MLTLETRRATLGDAAAMSRLAMELGYDCDEPTMRRRILALRAFADHATFVGALGAGAVIGWIHLEIRRGVLLEPCVEVTGLVVAAKHRRLGVGRALLERADDWAAQNGIGQMRACTQPHRTEAIAFYQRHGYTHAKDHGVYLRTRSVDLPPAASITVSD